MKYRIKWKNKKSGKTFVGPVLTVDDKLTYHRKPMTLVESQAWAKKCDKQFEGATHWVV